jgi:hypothetical protein
LRKRRKEKKKKMFLFLFGGEIAGPENRGAQKFHGEDLCSFCLFKRWCFIAYVPILHFLTLLE